MTVPFATIPQNLRTPLFFVEFDNSMANTATATQRTLLIGQMLDSATGKDSIPERITSGTQAAERFGRGSMLHTEAEAYFRNDTAGEVWVLPLADTESQTAAAGKLKITSAANDTGVISLYIAGIRVQMAVVATDTAEAIATGLAKVINRNTNLPVTAAAEADTVTLTAKNKGAHGNGIDIRLNYLGLTGGESTPSGFEMTITAMSGGNGAPDLLNGLANLKDRSFDFIVNPYTDTASLDVVKTFLAERWAWDKQLYGHSYGVITGTYGQLADFGEKRNDQHASLLGVNGSPSPDYQWSAAYTGAIAQSLRNDPGRPLQTLVISGVLPPDDTKILELTERNNLLHSGISTFTVDDDGTVRVENIITTYQKNAYGDNDDSYLQVETLYLLMFVSRYLRTQVTSKFGRMKLAEDGTRFAPGSAIVTPNIIRAELIAQYGFLEFNGHVQDAKGFAAGLKVERNSQNPNRVDVLWTGTLINQLRVFALLNQFRLMPGN
ncbi:phage tail sheath subtilisin-like domain-containing protein [Morganella morganii]|uniref:phage tail sheath subtilisin-like domain-containing protein n=1 Tax=Morganella morganii TaxID=582 RepID=UPI000290F063|nr:phage tail sheath subtilisin-like domain-containing protein [Morganella morganii]AVK37146.1 phage tail sheath family protein [Morganella morganii]ELO7539082.1 phage tail sheath subtilisin-like domain-containing protein [Morganella morganii]EMP49870.1 Bacteriophage tail sheath protein [Morganella morganii SC01]MBO8063438.1 phage tail sheath subtilisin-like domain-containing protein [Morganella morganii]HCT1428359.1 phage tail sheath subtilisin-like domain-containing protein [Morganella morga